MRRNIFTGYIIGNRLNFKTFFEPIIDFIEIGNPKEPPREPYMRISSRDMLIWILIGLSETDI